MLMSQRVLGNLNRMRRAPTRRVIIAVDSEKIDVACVPPHVRDQRNFASSFAPRVN